MSTAFGLAAALSVLTWGVHTFVGGREVARPLLESSRSPGPRFTAYYCWHLVTIVLAGMAAAFAIAAWLPGERSLAIAATVLAALFAAWSIALVVGWRRPVGELPQWVLFLPIALAGAWGLVG